MTLQIVTAPAALPVTLAEFRAHRRIPAADTSLDSELTLALQGATARAETLTGLRLITQTLLLTLDQFPRRIELPVWPVQSVTSVVYDDRDGTEQTFATDLWRVVKSRKPWSVAPAYEAVWPTPRYDFDAVRVTFVAGFGDEPDDVPADVRSAIMLIASDLFEHREGAVIGATVGPIPVTAHDLLRPHRFFA